MILTFNKIEVPKEWWHELNIKNKYNNTLFDIHIRMKTIPP